MDCQQVQSRFTAYVDGDLRPAEERWVKQHLERCAACQEELAAMRRFLGDCHEFLVHPGQSYTFEQLRVRMATIEPLEEIIAYLPKLRINNFIPRFAVAMVFMMLVSGAPYTLRNSRHVYDAVRLSFKTQADQWEDTDTYQEKMDRQYREQQQELGRDRFPSA